MIYFAFSLLSFILGRFFSFQSKRWILFWGYGTKGGYKYLFYVITSSTFDILSIGAFALLKVLGV